MSKGWRCEGWRNEDEKCACVRGGVNKKQAVSSTTATYEGGSGRIDDAKPSAVDVHQRCPVLTGGIPPRDPRASLCTGPLGWGGENRGGKTGVMKQGW
jgi:hypothetical protein